MTGTDLRESERTLADEAGVLGRYALWIVGLTILGALGGAGWAAAQPDAYAATAVVQILAPEEGALLGGQAARTDARDVDTEVEIIESSGVRREAAAALGDRADGIDTVSATATADADIVRIRVTSGDPEVARDAANAVAEGYLTVSRQQVVDELTTQADDLRALAEGYADEIATVEADLAAVPDGAEAAALEARLTALVGLAVDHEQRADQLVLLADLTGGRAELVDAARLPGAPFEPRPLRAGLIGGLLGLLVAICGAFIADRVVPTVRATTPVEAGLPVLGRIPVRGRRRPSRRLPTTPHELAPPTSPTAEAIRSLRVTLRHAEPEDGLRCLAVTSPLGSSGASTVTANLAHAVAATGRRVVAVSADLRRPTLEDFFGLPAGAGGLAAVLAGEQPLSEALVEVEVDGEGRLDVLPAGVAPADVASLLDGPRTGTVLRELAADADLVLLDCPPVLPVADTLTLAPLADGVLLVCVPGATRTRDLRQAAAALGQVGATLVGTVLDGVGRTAAGRYPA